MSFGSGIANYAKKTCLTIDNAVVAICAKASGDIIRRTPVDTGRARGNWYASIGEASSNQSETRTQGEAIVESTSVSTQASGKVFWLTNNLPYIQKLEFGSSKQAPAGMVRVTVQEIKKELAKI